MIRKQKSWCVKSFPWCFFFLRGVRSESSGSPDPTWRVNPHSPLHRFRLNYRSSCSQKAPPSTPGPPETLSLPCKCDTFQTFSHNTSTLEGTNIEAEEGRRRGGMKECTNSSGGTSTRKWNNKCQVLCLLFSPSLLRDGVVERAQASVISSCLCFSSWGFFLFTL